LQEFNSVIISGHISNAIARRKNDKLRRENARLSGAVQLWKDKFDKASSNLTELEEYCVTCFEEVPKFAYKEKGIFKNNRYSMYPNELISPESFLVTKCRREVGTIPKDFKAWVLKVGKYVDNRLKWTSDKDTSGNIDTWQDIYATILSKREDCENHSSLAASIEPELGIAFGFCGETGHAWNVFMYKDELWCLETNSVYDRGRNARVFKYKGQSKYKIHFIFTQNKTFQCVTKPVRFGIKER
jgi:hypothetical protein